MKELKILGVIVLFTLATYLGVEPLAHAVFHPHVEPADYKFRDIEPLKATGSVVRGEALVQANCTACHGIGAANVSAPMGVTDSAIAYGVVPPDLSNAGHIYEANFLAGFMKDPAKATKTAHKFGESNPHPMPGYAWMSDQEIADMVVYLQNIAPKEMSDKEVFEDACARCHSMKYAGITALTSPEAIKPYMGSFPPDLSQMIRSRGEHRLNVFINDPQKTLEGTAMPRVGLTKEAQDQVVSYMEQIGDSKKDEREALGVWVIGFMLILTVLAYLWKQQIWREVH